MDSALFFYLSAVGYFFGFVFYLLHLIGSPAEQKTGLGIVAAPQSWVLKQTTWGKLATWTTLVTVLISTVGMVLRSLGDAPRFGLLDVAGDEYIRDIGVLLLGDPVSIFALRVAV
jgi:hypothetical protein